MKTLEEHREIVASEARIVSRKLNLMFLEFPEEKAANIKIIGSYDGFSDYVGDYPYIECSTIEGYRISGVGYKAARFFEDA